jgi:hypothetical protein
MPPLAPPDPPLSDGVVAVRIVALARTTPPAKDPYPLRP